MRKLLLLFLWGIAMCSLPLCSYSRNFTPTNYFQASTITGKVVDEAGEGMPGVNVIVKGTSNGTTTDAEGVYRLSLSGNDGAGTLVFSFIGYTVQEQPINNRSTINVTMAADVQELTEVVVVGYGTQEKRDVTSSISTVSGEAISKIPTGNAMDAIKGQIAGVDVLQNGGRPGQAPTVTVRGRRSLTASNEPLWVIDGIPMTAGQATISDFNTADIESVEVLKDAASQAVYGSRGSNGVILVTTKRGQPGVTNVNFTTTYGITQPWRTIPMMNGAQFADLKREANRVNGSGQSGRTAWGDVGSVIPDDAVVFNDPVELNSVQNGLSTDWQDLIYQNGSQLNNQLSISGGSEKTRVFLAFNNFQEDGLIEGTDYKRYTGRINVDQEISKRFKVGVSSIYSNVTNNWGSGSVISEAVNQTPLGLPYDSEGKLIFLPISDGIRSNPLNELVPGKRVDERKTTRVFSSVYLDVNIMKGLTYKFLLGQDQYYFQRGIFEGQFTNTRKNGTPFASLEKFEQSGYTLENLLTYNKSAGEHNIGVTLLQSAAEQKFQTSSVGAQNLPYESALWNRLDLGTVTSYGTNAAEYQLLSYMARVNYSFKGKYLFQASMRWDGSSRLAEGNKWNGFPGVSAGWRIKDEGFMSGVNFVSELKLRASYGKVGNTAVAPYQTQGTLTNTFYDWNDTDAKGFRLDLIANPNLSWEYSESLDAGIDFGFFNGRLTGFVDVYHTTTGTSLLLNRQLPPTSGYAFILQNIGGTETDGLEVTLYSTIVDRPNSLKWTADFNFGTLKEKIVDLALRGANGELVDDRGNGWFIGQPVRVFYDYNKLGIWQVEEKDQAAAYGQFPGEIKVEDVNGDGRIDLTNDRKILGNDVPKAYGGLNNKFEYKGIDFSFFFYYRLGFMINSEFNNGQATMQARYNNLMVDYWTIDNPTNAYPRPNKNQESITYGSSLNYVDGGFVKLRNVTLGYTLPSNISEKLKMTKLRVFVTAQNLATWSKYKLFDPERAGNVTSGEMPSSRLFLGGINISF
ncbi:TonB-dependent receptor [Chryseolinea sp. H1M3-3]|uniref:SusC/RagA family TonB-linked outer membrane protein n=1 Tax=Chryseolinea sp. H1M3-3 TaxID=3034144 RepID=UPI0023EBE101|nr:TonB-dependent receptor [Chryseolinea sp. H1M3-3]